MQRSSVFPRPSREVIEESLPPGTLSDSQSNAVWSFFLRCSDPSEVSHTFRSYRDSPHCSIPHEKLRSMRDVMIMAMRESNKNSDKPLKERRKGKHYPDYFETWHPEDRKSA